MIFILISRIFKILLFLTVMLPKCCLFIPITRSLSIHYPCVDRNSCGKGGNSVWDSHAYHIHSAGGRRREPVPPQPPLRRVPIIPQPGFRSTKLLHTHCGGAAGGSTGIQCQGVFQCVGCERQPPCFQSGDLFRVTAGRRTGWHLLPVPECVR